MHMPTNLAIDDDLLDEALHIGGFKTKRETVNTALRELIQRRRRLALVQSFGTFDLVPYEEIKARRQRGIHARSRTQDKKRSR